MRRLKLGLPSPAMIIALIALGVALSGGAYAAQGFISALAKDSVGSAQLKNKSVGATELKQNAVTTSKIKNKVITGSKLKDQTITKAKLAPGVEVSGPAGPAGPPGEAGPAGAPGANGATNLTIRNESSLFQGNVATGRIFCNPGEKATGGGFTKTAPTLNQPPLFSSIPVTANSLNGWEVSFGPNPGNAAFNVELYVICAAP